MILKISLSESLLSFEYVVGSISNRPFVGLWSSPYKASSLVDDWLLSTCHGEGCTSLPLNVNILSSRLVLSFIFGCGSVWYWPICDHEFLIWLLLFSHCCHRADFYFSISISSSIGLRGWPGGSLVLDGDPILWDGSIDNRINSFLNFSADLNFQS